MTLMPSSKRLIRIIMFYQGFILLLVAATWIFDFTPGRLNNVAWMKALLELVPGITPDDVIGFFWAASGTAMIIAGSRLSRNRPGLENLGFTLGAVTPILVGFIFMAGFFFGGAQNAYIATISYMIFVIPYLAYLRLKPDEVVSDFTGELPVQDGGH